LPNWRPYDAHLDGVIDRALPRPRRPGPAQTSPLDRPQGPLKDLRELPQSTLSRLADGAVQHHQVSSGDWHLARIYQALAAPLPPGRLAQDHRRETQDPGRPVPAPPGRPQTTASCCCWKSRLCCCLSSIWLMLFSGAWGIDFASEFRVAKYPTLKKSGPTCPISPKTCEKKGAKIVRTLPNRRGKLFRHKGSNTLIFVPQEFGTFKVNKGSNHHPISC